MLYEIHSDLRGFVSQKLRRDAARVSFEEAFVMFHGLDSVFLYTRVQFASECRKFQASLFSLIGLGP